MYYADNGAIHGLGVLILLLLTMLFVAVWQQEFGQIAWVQRCWWFIDTVWENPQSLFFRGRRVHSWRYPEGWYRLITASDRPEELGKKVFRRLYKKHPGDYLLDELVSEEEWKLIWAQPYRFARSLNEEAKRYGCSAMITGRPPAKGVKKGTVQWHCPQRARK